MMTFAEMTQKGLVQYPSNVDSAFQETVYDWFQFREVCDDVRFPIYFKRVINDDYLLYRQLLRVEPGISEYDWLVQKYEESQIVTDRNSSITGTSSLSTAKENGGTITDAKTQELTSTKSGTVEETTTDTKNISHSTIGSDDTTSTLSGSDTRTDDLADSKSVTYGKSITKDYDGDRTVTLDGETVSKELGRDNPMSASYVGSGFPSTMDWTNPSSQNESTESRDDSTRTVTDDTTSTTESGTDTTSGTNTGTVTTAYGKIDTKENDTTQTLTGTDTENKSFGRESAESRTDGLTGSNTKTLATTEDTTVTGSDSKTNAMDELIQRINTGRSVDPATLLVNASAFIKNSNAWDWMRKRLEVCFMGIYE